MNPLPLAGLTVLDFSIARAGPTAVRLLSDWGADVIRIEAPPQNDTSGASITGDNLGPDEQNLHRNKRGLSLDLKHPDGQQILKRLVSTADIVVENFRATVKQKLGLEYETLKAINPKIILASISGFGQSGPYASRPGVDQIVQGMSGLMSITGNPGDGPMRTGIAISDTTAGMFLGQGILLALLEREKTGVGQWVHTSLLESMLNKLDFQAARYTMNGEVAEQQGNYHPVQVPMGLYLAKDGEINLAASTGKMWRSFCSALGAEHLLQMSAYKTGALKVANKNALNQSINDVTQQFTVAELVTKLNDAGVPCGPVLNIGQAFENEQSLHLNMRKTAHHNSLGDIDLVRSPINLSEHPNTRDFDRAAPAPGEHSQSILNELGFSAAEISQMHDSKVI